MAFSPGNIHKRTAELGYYIAQEYWGKGIMTEAVKQICEYVFDSSDIIRIYAEPFAHNSASCRVLEKQVSSMYSPVYLYLCSLVANFPDQELSDKDKELIRQYSIVKTYLLYEI